MNDAVSLIQQDHRVLEKLLHQLRDPAVDRVAVVEEVRARLAAHRRAAEQVYPLLAGDDRAADQMPDLATAEERLEALRASDPSSDRFDGALREFSEAVAQHIQTEETEVLPEFAIDDDPKMLERAGAAFDDHRVDELRVYGIDDRTPGH
ncbi:hemerythrin domain-containing protein [Micromonospora sp. NPDC050417]|uniref:hemerythrin domain-containing protein n=1 Tax=Micromonospora sp. NPDC050417 TaxID=3364280 RepID=UPI0037A10E7A